MIGKIVKKIKNLNLDKLLKNSTRIFVVLILLILIAPLILYALTSHSQKGKIYRNIQDVPARRVAIVFGAAIWSDTTPSDVLRDRILTAVELYKAGKVEKIIMSGDNRFVDYNEPGTMIDFAQSQGIPEDVLQPDYAGRRTYDTCYRAKYIFGLEEAILVTQEFHLTRAMYTCSALGIDSIGVASDLSEYPSIKYMTTRDLYALTLAYLDVNLRKPSVVLGEEIRI
ncbi:YdcF family protein [Candidatus Dojkabacteria bacterium]|nr:YdcF family protein [Candidatus Dojkabacteria bacterium]